MSNRIYWHRCSGLNPFQIITSLRLTQPGQRLGIANQGYRRFLLVSSSIADTRELSMSYHPSTYLTQSGNILPSVDKGLCFEKLLETVFLSVGGCVRL
uniref:Putative uncharacterized 10.9 kDa protein in spoC1 gene cluster region n=1 Tax=Emericella nidulans TaxID=162425 RepID=Y109_EMEND|nr:RecName: Full=Putative uncharacterized 10.9 kDa protein in spoC1 gene cluster region [Aspergillus nidulans]CAA25866.1 unnamed protein product [Aspergillus nidulans]